jgi:hypothetical protein
VGNTWWRHTTGSDVEFVADNMRQADRDEVIAGGHDHKDGLRRSVELTDVCFTLDSADGPLLICGAKPKSLTSDVGIPWLLGSFLAEKHPKVFLKDAPLILGVWFRDFNYLENYVHAEYKQAVNWLQRIGFTLGETIKIPKTDEHFIRFHMEKENV